MYYVIYSLNKSEARNGIKKNIKRDYNENYVCIVCCYMKLAFIFCNNANKSM